MTAKLCVLAIYRRRGAVFMLGTCGLGAADAIARFEERLISHETLQELVPNGALPVAVDADFERFIAAPRALLNERLAAVDLKAKGGCCQKSHSKEVR